jgi:hypothetical protein
MPTYYVQSGDMVQIVEADDEKTAIVRTIQQISRMSNPPPLGIGIACSQKPEIDNDTFVWPVESLLKELGIEAWDDDTPPDEDENEYEVVNE